MNQVSLPYEEPDIKVILILSSFLLILNIIGKALDNVIYCGLLGQIFIGVAWGVPGGGWLSLSTQESVVKFGYLGLILLVYEGGLSTDFYAMKSHFFRSVFLALTGIIAPIGLSFVLMKLAHADALQSFAAGASLCSTSLGTTLTVLKVSGLKQSRLGVVLTCAAMLDDVVGLVMAQIISNLGSGHSSFSAIIVVRPILVSIAFAVVVPLVCKFLVEPFAVKRLSYLLANYRFLPNKMQITFLTHTLVLVGFVVGSSYAGTSNLYAAYLAGASIGWYDSEVRKSFESTKCTTMVFIEKINNENDSSVGRERTERSSASPRNSESYNNSPINGSSLKLPKRPPFAALKHVKAILGHKYYTEGNTVSVQNNFGKSITSPEPNVMIESPHIEHVSGLDIWDNYYETPVLTVLRPFFFASIGFSIPIKDMFRGSIIWRGVIYAILMTVGKFICGAWLIRSTCFKSFKNEPEYACTFWSIRRARSFISPSIMGWAMVARGEIGFLIAALADSRDIFTSEQFLIVTWAIVICTIVGPIMVGWLTSKVRKIRQSEELDSGENGDPMEIWA
ncbi:LAFE_0C02916g1_1 [Lachancea fermentati]|uniref:LAFE_0C02916g1_1 n=1 Tax=Lachancea fermentati TaxID=4955 RepID=A0A1G4M980_LACFM|nr:LAFE_0C02916g1_1 [Lachancea fermentati]